MHSTGKKHEPSSTAARSAALFGLAFIAFIGLRPNDASASYKTTCTAWIGTPEKPNSDTAPCNLVVVNPNTLTVSGMKMQRISPDVTPFTLTGTWRSDDYACPDVSGSVTETLSIVQAGNAYIATKVTGDHCVTAGHVSFFGRIDLDTIVTEITAVYAWSRL